MTFAQTKTLAEPTARSWAEDDLPTFVRDPVGHSPIRSRAVGAVPEPRDAVPSVPPDEDEERTIKREVAERALLRSLVGLDESAGLGPMFERDWLPTIPGEEAARTTLVDAVPEPDDGVAPLAQPKLETFPPRVEALESLPEGPDAHSLAPAAVDPWATTSQSFARRRRSRTRLLALLVFAPAGAILGAIVSLHAVDPDVPATELAAQSPAAEPAPAPAASPSSDPETRLFTTEELATVGDPEALRSLERVPEGQRSPDQVWAIQRGRSEQRRAQLLALETSLSKAKDADQRTPLLSKLRLFVDAPDTAEEGLRVLAGVQDHRAADALYDVWVGTPAVTPTTDLARRFVHTKQVQSLATPALRVAIELRGASTCEQVAEALPRAVEHADRRSIVPLLRIAYRYPCNRGPAAVCYPCLEGPASLEDALRAARKR